MCFGPVASFSSSGILASIGAMVLKNVRARKELFFAAFPILFAIQQALEGVLWVLIEHGKPEIIRRFFTLFYLIFAYSIWPVLCPISVYVIEPDPERKKILRLLLLSGVATSL